MTVTTRRPAGRDAATSRSPEVPELGAAVRAALGYLADLSDPPSAVRDGRLDRMLRASLEAQADGAPAGRDGVPVPRRPGDGHRVVMEEVAAAVRAACAHLAADELEDAYLALRAAFDRLPRRLATAPDDDGVAPADV